MISEGSRLSEAKPSTGSETSRWLIFSSEAESMSTESDSDPDHVSIPRLLTNEDLPPELPLLNSGNELIGRASYQGPMGYSLHFEPVLRAKYGPSTLRSTKFIPAAGRPSALQIVMHQSTIDGTQ